VDAYLSNIACRTFIQLPRRSPAVPNGTGTLAVYTVSTYDLEAHQDTSETRILNIETKESLLFTDDKKNTAARWLVGDLLLWQRSVDGGATELWIGSAIGDKRYVRRYSYRMTCV